MAPATRPHQAEVIPIQPFRFAGKFAGIRAALIEAGMTGAIILDEAHVASRRYSQPRHRV